MHDICGNTIVMNDDYLEMCREVIRESNAKLSQSSVLNLDRVESKKGRVSRKSSNRSSSVGRSGGKEVKSYLSTSTMGRNMGKDVKVSVDSLLGTCREARLQQVARKSVLPRASSAGDGLFGDAFKISPIYSGVQSEYDLVSMISKPTPSSAFFLQILILSLISDDSIYPPKHRYSTSR